MARRDGRLVLIRWSCWCLRSTRCTVFTLKEAQIKAQNGRSLTTSTFRSKTYEEANESLREQIQTGLTDEDISELARSKLNYAEPGERIFVDASSR